MSRFHFISGLPRSGSTLLSAILCQNPRFYAGMSSPVAHLFKSVLSVVSANSEFSGQVSREMRKTLLRAQFTSYYSEQNDKEKIFDTNRSWTGQLKGLLELYPDAKMICCVRDVGWIMDSMERQFRKNPFENTKLFNDEERASVYSRVESLGRSNRMVGAAWSMLKDAYFSEEAGSMLLVDYDLLSTLPEKVMPLIYEFLGEPYFKHNFQDVQFDAPLFDANLGVEGLHRVSGAVKKNERATILPPDLFNKFSEMTFWHEQKGTRAHVIAAKT